MTQIGQSYHAMARRAFGAVGRIRDRDVSEGAAPILRTLDALRLQAAAGRELAVDSRPDSGLPFYNRVASAFVDRKDLSGDEGRRRVAEARRVFDESVAEALDTVILDKRQPSPVVEGQMKRAEYVLYLSALRDAHEGMVSQPVDAGRDSAPEDRGRVLTWTLWDMTVSCPVRYYLRLAQAVPPDASAFASALDATVRGYDSLAYPLAAVASAIDRSVPGAAVSSLRRVVYGPLFSPYFMTGAHPILSAMTSTGCSEDDFALEIRREDVVHDGQFMSRGFFTRTKDRVFTVDASRNDCMAAGATRIVRWLLTPHVLAQRLQDDPSLSGFVADRRVVDVDEPAA